LIEDITSSRILSTILSTSNCRAKSRNLEVKLQPNTVVAEFKAVKYLLTLNASNLIGNTGIASAAKMRSGKPKATEISLFFSRSFFLLRYSLPVKKLFAIFKREIKLITSSA
jgi:hypothetical protein